MAQKEVESWITIKGVHVPIFKGESKEDAVNRHTAEMNEKKKESDIAKAKEEADKLNDKNKDTKKKDVPVYTEKSKAAAKAIANVGVSDKEARKLSDIDNDPKLKDLQSALKKAPNNTKLTYDITSPNRSAKGEYTYLIFNKQPDGWTAESVSYDANNDVVVSGATMRGRLYHWLDKKDKVELVNDVNKFNKIGKFIETLPDTMANDYHTAENFIANNRLKDNPYFKYSRTEVDNMYSKTFKTLEKLRNKMTKAREEGKDTSKLRDEYNKVLNEQKLMQVVKLF